MKRLLLLLSFFAIAQYTVAQQAIGDVNNVDENGVATMLGQSVTVNGVAHGFNINPLGYSFALIDVANKEGINVYSGEKLDYSYAEGDSLQIEGVIGQFNGLTQVEVTKITKLSSGNDLMDPIVITALGEDTESLLVTMKGVKLVDPSKWGGDRSFNVDVTDGTNVITLRIDSDTDISDAPEGTFDVIGIGGQFDRDEPLTSGYQLFPRSSADFVVEQSGVEVTSNTDNKFTPATVTIKVGETVTWKNNGGFHNVNGTTDTYPDNPEGFTNGNASGSAWTFTHTFTKAGTYDYRCDPHAGLGMVGKVIVEELPSEYEVSDIAPLRAIDADGVAQNLDKKVEISGVAHGLNLRSNGLQFTLIDGNGDGIGLFSLNSNFGITYAEGQGMTVRGVVGQYNGLTQVVVDTAYVTSEDNALVTPTEVSVLDESTESQLVTIAGELTFVDASQWGNDGKSFNIELTDGTNTYLMRVDRNTDLAGMEAPMTPAKVTGIGGQFDRDAPYDSGYQIFPRSAADIVFVTSVEDEIQETINIYPNPVSDVLTISTEAEVEKIEVNNVSGQLIMSLYNVKSVDVSGIDAGTYYLKMYAKDKVKTMKFLKI